MGTLADGVGAKIWREHEISAFGLFARRGLIVSK